jgi:hypothetical protein
MASADGPAGRSSSEPGSGRDVHLESDPGVPEAVAATVRMLGERLGPHSLDRIWVFPPRVRGRKEWGLVAASRFHRDDPDRRLLFTAPYSAERTRNGPEIQSTLHEEGEAPPDRFPRVMDGVVRRSGEELGEPKEFEIGGDGQRFDDLVADLDRA